MTQRITFDPCFDSDFFPGPLAGRNVVVGEAWVGPHGLLNILEIAMGLSGRVLSQAERAAGLISVMKDRTGFWSESCAVDPFGAADALLRRRDALSLQGWRGEGEGRLAELARVTATVQPGYPDRLTAVVVALEDRECEIDIITRFLPVADLPRLWDLVFAGLRRRGVKIEDRGIDECPAVGNLLAARKAGFVPCSGDESLQMLRTAGPLEAAERIAAYLAGLNDLSGTVVIGSDSVLDAALHRYNLPSTGAKLGTGGNALLEILPLVLACGWTPADPMRALELLSLPVSPIPRGIASGLADALHKWPAVGSQDWTDALNAGLAVIEKGDDRKRIATRLQTVFSAAATQAGAYPVDAIQARLGMLIQWMQGRKLLPDEKRLDLWDAAITQCTVFKRLLEFSGVSLFTAPFIGRLLEKAGAEVAASLAYPAEAGLAHVKEPGGIVGPVDRVIWWSFTKNSAPSPERPFLTRAESALLLTKGVSVPDPGNLELAEAARRRRPLLLARKQLILVCPHRDYAGEELAPHPLWDEVVGRLKDGGKQVPGIEVAELRDGPDLTKVERHVRALPAPVRDWHVKTVIPGRESESASGAGTLLGCPLAWVLKYACRVKAGATASLPADNQLWGSLAHHIIKRVMATKPATAGAAADAAGKVFDEEAPRLAANFFLPGGDAERIAVRETAVKAVNRLWELVLTGKTSVVSSEEKYEGVGLGTSINGTVDLVVGSPMRVVDFKWSGGTGRQESLSNGEAYQLAVYGHLVAGDHQPACPGAYFILKNQTLITTDKAAFPKADVVVHGPSADDTWQAFERAYKARIGEVVKGLVIAGGIPPDPAAGAGTGDDGEDALQIEAPCRYCEYGGICCRAKGGA